MTQEIASRHADWDDLTPAQRGEIIQDEYVDTVVYSQSPTQQLLG